MKDGLNWKKIVFPCVALILLFVIVFSGLHILESTVFNSEQEESTDSSSKTIAKEETEFFPRQDITTVLFMGIDDYGPVKDSGNNINEGFSDVIALLIFDEKSEKINAIVFNRDTMTEMATLDDNGRRNGVFYGQMAYAHTFGRGLEDSCENAVHTVSDLLGGFEIDYYVSLNMGAIPLVNDAVGGVTVNVTDDFSKIDPDITMGEFLLMGDQSLTFIQARKNIGDTLNISRMERQKEYVKGFFEAFKASYDGNSLIVTDLLEAVDEYMVTNCSGNTIMSMAERYENYEFGEIVSPEGENILGEDVLGEKHYEFYIDEKSLEEMVLEYLYAPK